MNKGAPGRVPFKVEAPLVSTDAKTLDEVWVCADGIERAGDVANGCQSSQDPCVFSSPIGPIHSFCRTAHDAGEGRNRVLEAGGSQTRFLTDLVEKNDIIIYGRCNPFRGDFAKIDFVFVDTVLIVKAVHKWPALEALGVSKQSIVYRYNLVDGYDKGRYAKKTNPNPAVVEGIVAPTTDALQSLRTSFVPLAEDRNGSKWPALVYPADCSAWEELTGFFRRLLSPTSEGRGLITEFPNFRLAEELCRCVIATSGRTQDRAGYVAIPPLSPRPLPQRIAYETGKFVDP